jgi:hypothetical protein
VTVRPRSDLYVKAPNVNVLRLILAFLGEKDELGYEGRATLGQAVVPALLLRSEHFPGLADTLDCLAADQLWALLSMRVQLANSNQLQAQSAAVRFGGLGRRYVLVAFNDRPVGLLSHADGSGPLPRGSPKAHRPFLGRDPPRLDAGHRLKLGQHVTKSDGKNKLANRSARRSLDFAFQTAGQ